MESFLTSVELESQGISRKLAYDWFDALESQGMARRAPGRVYGTKLFAPQAIEFLQTRRGKVGSPGLHWSRAQCLAKWVEGEGK